MANDVKVSEKYKSFTDEEIYIMSRQCVESSFEIVMSGNYNDREMRVHEVLMNELIIERKNRRL